MKIAEARDTDTIRVEYGSLNPGDCWSFTLGDEPTVYMKDDEGRDLQLDCGISCSGEVDESQVYLLEDVKLTYRRPTA